MKIQLTNPCSVSQSHFTKTCNGYYCDHCKKEVVDYSVMGDLEYFRHIKKHGLGCGQFREDQLNRDVSAPEKRRSLLMFMPLLAVIFIKPISSRAQVKQDTVVSREKHSEYKTKESPADMQKGLDEEAIIAYGRTTRVFGSANICISERKKRSLSDFIRRIFKKN